MTLEKSVFDSKIDESFFVPKRLMHKIVNASAEKLETVEVQRGEYLSEKYIERVSDKSGRS